MDKYASIECWFTDERGGAFLPKSKGLMYWDESAKRGTLTLHIIDQRHRKFLEKHLNPPGAKIVVLPRLQA